MNRIILPLLIMATVLQGCVVSKKKYDALSAEHQRTRQSLNQTRAGLDSMRRAFDLQSDTLERVRQDSATLDQRLARVKEELQNLSQNYNQLRNNSTQEIKALIKELEDSKVSLREREARLQEVEDMLERRNEAVSALKNKIQQALLGYEKLGLSVEERNGNVYVSLTDKLLFESGSIRMDQRGRAALGDLSGVLRGQKDLTIMVEGHTDDVPVSNLGQIKDNWDLSVLRSTTVVRYLTTEGGLDPRKVVASGRAEFMPLDPAKTTEARARNRRTEIILIPDLDELMKLIRNE